MPHLLALGALLPIGTVEESSNDVLKLLLPFAKSQHMPFVQQLPQFP